MRLWSLHPRYLDAKGLVALWREGLLAQAVLLGRTRGYTRHPQLARFRAAESPSGAIAQYLRAVLEESLVRGYRFDALKIGRIGKPGVLTVTDGQLAHEWRHLTIKLQVRDPRRAATLATTTDPRAHPLFKVVAGPVEPWEKT